MFTQVRPVFAAAVLLTTALAAQTSRSGSYYKSIGNTWLGGTVYTSASVSTTVANTAIPPRTTRTGNASAYAGVDGYLLRHTLPALQLNCSARNTVVTTVGANPTQNAAASLRLMLCGINVWDRSVATTGDLGGISQRTYMLFGSQGIRGDVPVGPFTIGMGGNAGVTFGAGAMVIFPTTTPEVRLILSANTAVLANLRIDVGVSGFRAGFELLGRFAEQRLTVSVIVNALTAALSGMASYEIRAMSVRFVAFLEALWVRVYQNTLTSWSSALHTRDFLNL